MPDNKKKLRKRGLQIEQIEDSKKKAVVDIIKPIMDESGYTIKAFADETPKVSLSTMNNLLSPKYGSAPTVRTIRLLAEKIANISKKNAEKDTDISKYVINKEEIYGQLIEAIGKSVEEYPFDESKPIKKKELPINDNTLKYALISAISGPSMKKGTILLETSFRKHLNHNLYFNLFKRMRYYDLVIDYTELSDAPIDYWMFETYINPLMHENVLESFLMELLLSAKERTKYSFVTNSELIFEELPKIEFMALNVYLSVIFWDGDTFSERYIKTAINSEAKTIEGLTLGRKNSEIKNTNLFRDK